jgi:hypothetical protein
MSQPLHPEQWFRKNARTQTRPMHHLTSCESDTARTRSWSHEPSQVVMGRSKRHRRNDAVLIARTQKDQGCVAIHHALDKVDAGPVIFHAKQGDVTVSDPAADSPAPPKCRYDKPCSDEHSSWELMSKRWEDPSSPMHRIQQRRSTRQMVPATPDFHTCDTSFGRRRLTTQLCMFGCQKSATASDTASSSNQTVCVQPNCHGWVYEQEGALQPRAAADRVLVSKRSDGFKCFLF